MILVIAAYIATLCVIKLVLHILPLEEDRKKLIMQTSGCFASVAAFLYHYRKTGTSPMAPLSPKLSQMSTSDSFSQASVFSGASLLSEF